MKIAIINYCGTVGKTTIAAHLLAPRLQGYKILSIESINENASSISEAEFEQMKSGKFSKIFNEIIRQDNLILDVGASNVENFMNGLANFATSYDYIDIFIVPITPETKAQKESVATVAFLLDIGIPAEKIKIIFNRADEDANEDFKSTINKLSKLGIKINANLIIAETELFDNLGLKKMNIKQLFNQDYKQILATKEKGSKEYDNIVDLIVMQANAVSIDKNLDNVFKELGL